MGVAARVLVDRNETRHAAAALVFRTHRMTGPFRSDHQHVEVGARLDQIEMDVEAVGEHQRCGLLHVGSKFVAIDVGLQFVGRQHHHDVGPFGGAGDVQHLDAFGFGLLGGGRTGPEGDRDVLDTAVTHVEQMGVALAAVADDGNRLAFDEIEVGIPVVIDAHLSSLFWRSKRCFELKEGPGVRFAGPVVGVSSECGRPDQAQPAGESHGTGPVIGDRASIGRSGTVALGERAARLVLCPPTSAVLRAPG